MDVDVDVDVVGVTGGGETAARFKLVLRDVQTQRIVKPDTNKPAIGSSKSAHTGLDTIESAGEPFHLKQDVKLLHACLPTAAQSARPRLRCHALTSAPVAGARGVKVGSGREEPGGKEEGARPSIN